MSFNLTTRLWLAFLPRFHMSLFNNSLWAKLGSFSAPDWENTLNKRFIFLRDSQDQDTEDDVKEWAEVHHDDILCLASFRHNNGVATIASSSYDGNVFIWSLDSGMELTRTAYKTQLQMEFFSYIYRSRTMPIKQNDQLFSSQLQRIQSRQTRQTWLLQTQSNTRKTHGLYFELITIISER